MKTIKKIFGIFAILVLCSSSLWAGKIIRPWRATTAIVEAGKTFEVWFDASGGQTVNSVQLRSEHKTINVGKSVQIGSWTYDKLSGNKYDNRITVTVPSSCPYDRYDLILKTSQGDEKSPMGVKVIKKYKDEYYIMHFSDAHRFQGGYDEEHTLRKVSEMLKIAEILDPEMIIETGDNMYSVRNHPEREDMYYNGIANKNILGMHDTKSATFMVFGNHDSPNNLYSKDASIQETADFVNKYYGIPVYNFKYGNGRYICVANQWGGPGNITRQATDAKAWLDSSGHGNFIMAAGHAKQTSMEPVAQRINLDVALAGHTHFVAKDNPHILNGKNNNFVADSVRDLGNFEFNLYKVNNNTGVLESCR